MTNSKQWEMNETQKNFVEILRKEPNGITLAEIKDRYGVDFKTGSINTLKAHEIVDTEKTSVECLIVRADDTSKVVGHCKKEVSIWKLR